MPPRRHVPSPPVECLPRSAVDSGIHPAVDAVLKQLKASSRRLQAALASHRTELQVLERLYYKGKNQHRPALFWQRVADIRKFGERLDEMHIDDAAENLRLSFWGEPSVRTPKLLKGPWTHYPNAKSVLFVLERCSACCMLIDRSRERLMSAYESFTLMMQTGAFLQLILTLAAIASRMSILLTEVRAALEITWSASYIALQHLHPSEVNKVRTLVKMTDDGHVGSASARSNNPTLKAASKVTTEVFDEDLGSTIVRPVQPPEDAVVSSPSEVAPHPPDPVADEQESVDMTMNNFSLSLSLDAGQTTHSRQTMPCMTLSPALDTIITKRKKSGTEAASAPIAKKKKKKRDEIDDIFGF